MYSDIEISDLPGAELLLAIKILKFSVFNFLAGQLSRHIHQARTGSVVMREDRRGCNVRRVRELLEEDDQGVTIFM